MSSNGSNAKIIAGKRKTPERRITFAFPEYERTAWNKLEREYYKQFECCSSDDDDDTSSGDTEPYSPGNSDDETTHTPKPTNVDRPTNIDELKSAYELANLGNEKVF